MTSSQTAHDPRASKPANLLIVRPSLAGGGADRVTTTLLRHLDRTRFCVSLALIKHSGPFAKDLPEDVIVYELGGRRLWTAWLPLARLLRRECPDILFSTSGGMNIAAVLAHLVARSRARLVLSERGLLRRELGLKKRLLASLKKMFYRQADLVTTVSEGVRQQLIDVTHLAAESVVVVHNPIVDDDLALLAAEPVEHPWFSEDIPIILAAGRLVEEKDYPNLFRALALAKERTRVRLVLLGDGPRRRSLVQLAEKLDIASDMHFAGFDKNPFKYMQRCTVFALSSRFEGLPGVLIQAMACGAPVVSTDCPSGPREIVENGVNGLLVPVGDSPAFASALVALLDNPDRRAELAERGRESARRFHVDRILPVYEQAILGEMT